MWGTSRDEEPSCMVVPEPRNRGLRFEALAEFGTEFLAYLSEFEGRDEAGMCLDAPQLVVPNAATADWLGGIVGRFTRNLQTDGDAPAPPSVPLAGKHLSFFADLVPGSSLVLAATDALTIHWQTGQLPSEDLNLAALLGWIDPPAGMDGPQAARAGEASPPAGPDSDPNWDAETLAELIQEWHAADDEAPGPRYDANSRARSASNSPQRGQTAGRRWIASTPCQPPTSHQSMAVGPPQLDRPLRPDRRGPSVLPQHPDAGPGRDPAEDPGGPYRGPSAGDGLGRPARDGSGGCQR